MEKSITLWEETLFYGENGFYSKRIVPGRHAQEVREQINLGQGWETLCYVSLLKDQS